MSLSSFKTANAELNEHINIGFFKYIPAFSKLILG